MRKETPGLVDARHRGEIGKLDHTNLVPLTQDSNTSDLARKKVYENLGLYLARRGEINVSQFTASFVDLSDAVQTELFKRLVDFTRVPGDVYEQAGALRFPHRFFPIPGDRS